MFLKSFWKKLKNWLRYKIQEEEQDDLSSYPPLDNKQKMMVGKISKARFELWHYHAAQWDITHSYPPPPRNPKEFYDGLPNQHQRNKYVSMAPYQTSYWMDRCCHWSKHTISHFDFSKQHPESKNFVISASDEVMLENVACWLY